MTANSTSDILISRATVLIGPTGSEPTTPIGYKSGATKCTYKEKLTQQYVEDRDGPVFATRDTIEGSISAKAVQITTENLALAMGKTASGNEVSFGGVPASVLEYAAKVIGTRRDGKLVTFRLFRAVSESSIDLDIDKKKMAEIDLKFTGLDGATDSDVMGKITIGSENIVIALESGVLTRIANTGYHQIAGEGGAADSLTSIAGESLVNGETLRLQIADVDNPITLTHGTSLQLTGAVNWVMNKQNDWVDFKYNSTSSAWVETARYDAAA